MYVERERERKRKRGETNTRSEIKKEGMRVRKTDKSEKGMEKERH